MTQATETATAALLDLTSGLYQFMLMAEPALLSRRRAGDDRLTKLPGLLEDLQSRCATARDLVVGQIQAVVDDAALRIEGLRGELTCKEPCPKQLRDLWHALSHDYERLRQHARQRPRGARPSQKHVGQLKPKNPLRNLFHVANGAMGVIVYEFGGANAALAVGCSLLVIFGVMELFRRRFTHVNERFVAGLFGLIARPSEHNHVPSGIWYVLALVIGVLLLPAAAIEAGVVALAVGDPAASLAGKKWGRNKKILRQKSYAGTAAFMLVALAVGAPFLHFTSASLTWGVAISVAAAAAVAGGVAELFGDWVEDNFSVPIAGGLAATGVLFFLV